MKSSERTHSHASSMAPNFMRPDGNVPSLEKRQAVEEQYFNLLEVANSITTGEYEPKSEQELRDLGSWALKLIKSRALYPLQAENVLLAAGATFKDKGYRRFVRGVIEDIHNHMGDTALTHDVVVETWRMIDEGEETNIAKAALNALVKLEEARGFYREEVLNRQMASQALKNEKEAERIAHDNAIKNSDLLDVPEEKTVPYDPFAEEEDFDLVPVRRNKQ